jgi:hypothetical protein
MILGLICKKFELFKLDLGDKTLLPKYNPE